MCCLHMLKWPLKKATLCSCLWNENYILIHKLKSECKRIYDPEPTVWNLQDISLYLPKPGSGFVLKNMSTQASPSIGPREK